MNSNSIERQQNAFSQQEHLKIANIYQRMLSGDKSALSNLQKVKVHTHIPSGQKQLQETQNTHEQKTNLTQIQQKQLYKAQRMQNSPPSKKVASFQQNEITKNQTPSRLQLNETEKQSQKQKQKFRSYIKKKVNQLRTEKQILKNKEDKQITEIKKITQKIKIDTVNQSKSFDVVKKKQKAYKSPFGVNVQISPIIQQAKKSLQKRNLNKAQSSSQHKEYKNLPPLKDKKKIPTQNSQNSSRITEPKIMSRKQVITPVNLANSSIKVQLQSNSKSQKSIGSKNRHEKDESPSIKSNLKKNAQIAKSRTKKISLPEMKKQRQEFSTVNQHEKNAQFDIVQYHQQTKKFIEDTKQKYQLNFRNQKRLNDIKKELNIVPVLNIEANSKKKPAKQQQNQAQQKKKRISQIIEEKVNEVYKEISLIEDAIDRKKRQITQINQKLNKNLLIQFWNQHDLQTSDFQVDSQDQSDQEGLQINRQLSQSQLNQAYSTAMPVTKDKKWKWNVIKQYDTNRSMQSYAKSRSMVKQNHSNLKNLNQIQQDEQSQDYKDNKVTVNSRLKKLLLQ